MLHGVTTDGGMGFCHGALPLLLPSGYHGPLVVALDSNVLIDFQEHGNVLLNGGVPAGLDEQYARDLAGLADLVNLWLLRDIRFVVTASSLTDAKRITLRFLERRLPAVEAIAESLAFQLGDWNHPAPSEYQPRPVGDDSGLPDGADRDLVLEAQGLGAHVFLTRDRLVINRVSLTGPAMAVESPSWLAAVLGAANAQPFSGGTCGTAACPYVDWTLPAPDMGKWGGLLSIFGGGE
jgi:hypothetical protein